LNTTYKFDNAAQLHRVPHKRLAERMLHKHAIPIHAVGELNTS